MMGHPAQPALRHRSKFDRTFPFVNKHSIGALTRPWRGPETPWLSPCGPSWAIRFFESIKLCWVYRNPDNLHAGLEIAKAALQLDPDEASGHIATGFTLLYLQRFITEWVALRTRQSATAIARF
jgi:hypothetical protein